MRGWISRRTRSREFANRIRRSSNVEALGFSEALTAPLSCPEPWTEAPFIREQDIIVITARPFEDNT